MTKLLTGTRLHDPGDLIAAVPHLIGFHPTDSLVVLVVQDDDIALTMRIDLPPPGVPHRVTDRLAGPLSRCRAANAVVIVVGGGSGDPPEDLPHDALVDEVDDALHDARVPLLLAVWTRATAKGESWFDYHDVGTSGTVPDPMSTALAAATAAEGHITYASREAMAELLTPDPPEALSRRATLLNRRAVDSPPPPDGTVPPGDQELIHAEVIRAATRKRPLTDEEVADLAHALSNPWARDASLAYCVGEHAHSAEALWAELTRACPTPERAEPATLLAFSAYIKGLGTLASLALDRAEQAHPGHRLTELLRAALDTGLSPDLLRDLAERAGETDWTNPPADLD
ncbi:hypothetical protein ALI22I_22150 [Saccharothrix sp. ALI-22-I]|uniref:DUF4192 domain-containing protein n=1 Tax=Saccharothrix sp. ALI-22-I TaxID=1933778 RepID=UPI00097C56BE|nr:DUF4192 domain-containing protein [Saccharothrix sp. ALI-22-I]ONI87164.1 hypothetical protein ALI22I_22150 [Saccharothrix sp. ALI-22-I]